MYIETGVLEFGRKMNNKLYECHTIKSIYSTILFLRFGFFRTKAAAMVNGVVVSYVMVKQDMCLEVT